MSTRSLGPDWVSTQVEGEVDLANADQLKEILTRELGDGRSVFLDLSQVEFIDSTGLAAIVNAQQCAAASGTALHLCSELRTQPRRLMELTGVLSMVRLADRPSPARS